MTPDKNEDIEELLKTTFLNSSIKVQGDGYHYNIQIISTVFSGKSTLQRHKMVYALLQEKITNGTLHAVILKTYTPEENPQTDS